MGRRLHNIFLLGDKFFEHVNNARLLLIYTRFGLEMRGTPRQFFKGAQQYVLLD